MSATDYLPIGVSLDPGIGNTYGLVVVAIILSSFLTGILCLQLYLYFDNFPKDPAIRKFLIVLIVILDIAQFACTVDFAWWYLVRNWGNTHALQIIRPSYGLYVVFGTIVIFIVQLMFLYRISTLGKRLRYLIIPMLALVVVESAFGMYGASLGLRPIPFTSTKLVGFAQTDVGMWLGSGVVVDVGIAVTLSISLHKRRTGFKRTDTLINKIILYTINTCALTCVIALFDIIAYYEQDKLMNAHLMCNMILSKLFSNSLMASYNRRMDFYSNDSLKSTTNGILVCTTTEREVPGNQGVTGIAVDQASTKVDSNPASKVDWSTDIEMFPVPKDAHL